MESNRGLIAAGWLLTSASLSQGSVFNQVCFHRCRSHLQVVEGVGLQDAEQRALALLEAELRVLREGAVDVTLYDVVCLLLRIAMNEKLS